MAPVSGTFGVNYNLACDEATNQILAFALTTHDIDYVSMLEPLLDELTHLSVELLPMVLMIG